MNKRVAFKSTSAVFQAGLAFDQSALLHNLLLASQMRMLDSLQADMAHQLRGPLNAMTLTAALLENSIKSGLHSADHQAKQLRYVEIVQQELHRLNTRLDQTINELMVVPQMVCEPIDLQKLVQSCVDRLSTLLSKKRVLGQFESLSTSYFTRLHHPGFQIVLFNLANEVLIKAQAGETLLFKLAKQEHASSGQTQQVELDIMLQAKGQSLPYSAQPVVFEEGGLDLQGSCEKADQWLAHHLLQSTHGALNHLMQTQLSEESSPVWRGYRLEFQLH